MISSADSSSWHSWRNTEAARSGVGVHRRELPRVGDALGISLVQMQKYLECAQAVLDESIVKTLGPPEVKVVTSWKVSCDGGEGALGHPLGEGLNPAGGRGIADREVVLADEAGDSGFVGVLADPAIDAGERGLDDGPVLGE